MNGLGGAYTDKAEIMSDFIKISEAASKGQDALDNPEKVSYSILIHLPFHQSTLFSDNPYRLLERMGHVEEELVIITQNHMNRTNQSQVQQERLPN